MSTILLTLTHIAQDHTVASMGYPSSVKVDENHRKIMANPDNTFFVASVGIFNPDYVSKPESMDFLKSLFINFIDKSENSPLSLKEGILTIKKEDSVRLSDIFVTHEPVILVSKRKRIIIFKEEMEGGFVFSMTLISDILAIGGGSRYIEGAMKGGATVAQAYAIASKYHTLTTSTFTMYNLNDLNEWDHLS